MCVHDAGYTFKSHLGCIHVLAIVNSAVMNIRIRVSFGIMAFSGYIPRYIPGLCDHMVVSFLIS